MSNEHRHSGAECQQQYPWHQRDVIGQLTVPLSDSRRRAVRDYRRQHDDDDVDDGRRQAVADGYSLPGRRSAVCRRSRPGHRQRLPALPVAASTSPFPGAAAARRANVQSAASDPPRRLGRVDRRRRLGRAVRPTT